MRPVFRRISFRPQPRRGQSLVMFAFVLIATLALAALLIDIGIVQLTRRQMQTAVNTAALEGLRFRDSIPVSVLHQLVDCGPCQNSIGEDFTEDDFYQYVRDYDTDCNCLNALDPEVRDYLRRKLASRAISTAFDDDLLSPTVGRPDRFGAGPLSPYGPGIPLDGTTFEASRLIEPGRFGRYVPDQLQLNREDDQAGDFVAGYHVEEPPREYDDYLRDGFALQRPPTLPVEARKDAFLARLRRTGEDFSALPTVVSAGPPVPFFFGRGTAFLSPALLDRRERGTNVRATAIAVEKAANTVGPSYPQGMFDGADAMPGLTPIAINQYDFLNNHEFVVEVSMDCTANVACRFIRATVIQTAISPTDTSMAVAASGGFPANHPFIIRISDELARVNFVSVAGMTATWTIERGLSGTTPAAHDINDLVVLQHSLSVGTKLDEIQSATPMTLKWPDNDRGLAYVAIIDDVGAPPATCVIGFGLVQIAERNACVTLVRHSSAAIGQNASVSLRRTPSSLSASQLNDLFEKQRGITSAVLAPASVRTVPAGQH